MYLVMKGNEGDGALFTSSYKVSYKQGSDMAPVNYTHTASQDNDILLHCTKGNEVPTK